ncbi:histone RNA hairpin-binding protein [Tieghemostelium lacteum]|uniref:Histone RNA hairpin-binding protein n=1 Tax=Tieghemostelium lacteum TaxID=361077 RepID=A0A151ZFL2_TIELA|nr:histone RNA hairpin-binding protein [Tieghemostelium lacteum]|eukprot:KYQ92717.1 histone RNA hairpin-binding protein [Tieghemostelium lacteum]
MEKPMFSFNSININNNEFLNQPKDDFIKRSQPTTRYTKSNDIECNSKSKPYERNSNNNTVYSSVKYHNSQRNQYNYNDYNKPKSNSNDCKLTSLPSILKVQKETDIVKLKSRQKQIDFGKNTIGYDNYIKSIPRDKRDKSHPKTPDKFQKCSRRSWMGQIKKWRRELHKYDPNAGEFIDEEDLEDDDNTTTLTTTIITTTTTTTTTNVISNDNEKLQQQQQQQQQQPYKRIEKDDDKEQEEEISIQENQELLFQLLGRT